MSHDIRTPMNAIIGFSGLLEKNLQNEEKAKEYLGKICSSGNLLMTIINKILEIARIESGTTALQLKAEDINTLFHTVNTVFEEDVRKKNLQYSVDLDVYPLLRSEEHTSTSGDNAEHHQQCDKVYVRWAWGSCKDI